MLNLSYLYSILEDRASEQEIIKKSKNVVASLIHRQKSKEIQPFHNSLLHSNDEFDSDQMRQQAMALTTFSFDDVETMDGGNDSSRARSKPRIKSPTKLMKQILFQHTNIYSESQLMTFLRQKQAQDHYTQVHIPPAILALRNSKWYDLIEGNDTKKTYIEYILAKYFLKTPSDRELYREKIVISKSSDEMEENEEKRDSSIYHNQEYDELASWDEDGSHINREYSMQVPYSKVPKFTPFSRRYNRSFQDGSETLATKYIDRYQTCSPKIEEASRKLVSIYLFQYNPFHEEYFKQDVTIRSVSLSNSFDSSSQKLHSSDGGYEGQHGPIRSQQFPFELRDYLKQTDLAYETLLIKCKDNLLTLDQARVLLQKLFTYFSPTLSSNIPGLPRVVYLNNKEIMELFAAFCLWVNRQDTVGYHSKALKALHRWNRRWNVSSF